MTQVTMVSAIPPAPSLERGWEDVGISFERFCLTAGIGALEQMLRENAERLAGPRHGRNPERAGRRWAAATGKIGFHGGKVAVRRPRRRLRGFAAEDWLGQVGDEPDADQRLDAQAAARGAAAGGRSAGGFG